MSAFLKSLLFLLLLVSKPLFASFEIAEVMPNTADDSSLEYITLKNLQHTPQSLSGYTLKDASGKAYTFTGIVLAGGERKQFFRPETKIILNNTDETLTLFSYTGAKSDEISYKTSTKGIFLSFEDIVTDTPDDVISDELTISGEHFISPEVIIPKVPSVEITQQIPSYISLTGTGNEYVCDPKQLDCKVNFDLRNSFSELFPVSQYHCEIDFGLGIATGEEQKCNPNTVMFPGGTHQVRFRILSLTQPSIFSEKIIQVSKREIQTDTGGTQVQSTTGSGTGESMKVPEIKFLLQIPSYISQSRSLDTYICDPKQAECKVNFDLSSSFSVDFPSKNYRCEIDFGLGVFTGEEQKCNPNTLIFPQGESKIHFRIIHKDNENIVSTRILSIISDPKMSISSSASSLSSSISEKISKITLFPIKIGVQSGLSGEGRYFYCEKHDCKANFIYVPWNSSERCRWDFGEGGASSDMTHTRCNPGFVAFGTGSHELFLRVYENKNEINFKKYTFYVINEPEAIPKIEAEILETPIGEPLLSHIIVQGKLSKEKILSENLLHCNGVQKCFVNLQGELSHKRKDAQYRWFVNGEEFSQKLNPKGIWLTEGDYEILFQVYEADILQSEARFQVSVSGKQDIAQRDSGTGEILHAFGDREYSGLMFGKILPNPKGNDIKEFIEIKNTASESRQLGGCFIADSSKKYELPDEILSSGTSRYFFRGETGITLGNAKETLTLSCDGSVIEVQMFERKLRDDELITGEIFSGFTLEEVLTLVPVDLQETYLKKSLSLSFLILKRDGLKISGTTFPDTKIELFSEGKNIATLTSDASGKFLLKTKNIQVGQYDFDIRLSQGGEAYTFLDFKTLTLSISQRASWFKKALKKKKTSIKALPKLLVSREIPQERDSKEIELSSQEKMLYIFLLCIIALLVSGHIFFLSFPKKLFFVFPPRIELMRFQTRQKILLLGV